MAEIERFQGFFSYTHLDAEVDPGLVEALTTRLEKRVTRKLTNASFGIWRDKDKIRTGDRWDERIGDAVRVSQVLIVLMTPKWFESAYCRKEYQIFQQAERGIAVGEYVVPLLAHAIDKQIKNFDPEQKATYDDLNRRQYKKTTATNFRKMTANQRELIVEEIADEIEGMIDRLRGQSTCPPPAARLRWAKGTYEFTGNSLNADARAPDFLGLPHTALRSADPSAAKLAIRRNMDEVFISYKSERRRAAEHLAAVLERYGYSVWFDYQLIKGRDFGLQIDRKVREAKALVALWCTRSVESSWVAEDADLGRELGILIPVMIESCALPVGFRRQEYIDLSQWDGAPRSPSLDPLINALEQKIGRPPAPDLKALREYEATWRRFGAPPLRAFALGQPLAADEADRGPPIGRARQGRTSRTHRAACSIHCWRLLPRNGRRRATAATRAACGVSSGNSPSPIMRRRPASCAKRSRPQIGPWQAGELTKSVCSSQALATGSAISMRARR